MAMIIFNILMLLGAFFISTCITVLTFTVVDMRRTGMQMTDRLETLGDRNYTVMMRTLEIATANQVALLAIQKRLRLSEGDQPGN